MVNKDYILRLAERFGRALAIVLHLRQYNQYEEALIAIDDFFLRMTGLTTGLINGTSEEMLLGLLSPLGALDVEKCLWIIILLNEEGETYDALERPDDGYYRYVKSLNLALMLLLRGYDTRDIDLLAHAENMVTKLAEYEIPIDTRDMLFRAYDQSGWYARAEDVLFEMLEDENIPRETAIQIAAEGRAFYQRLLNGSDTALQAGNLSRNEAREGLAALQHVLDAEDAS